MKIYIPIVIPRILYFLYVLSTCFNMRWRCGLIAKTVVFAGSLLYTCNAWSQPSLGQHQLNYSLQIGDWLPETLWNASLPIISYPQGREYVQLTSHRGKLIILDFWGTTCSSCVKSLKAMRSVHSSSKDFAIIPVSWEKKEVITSFFNRQFSEEEPIYSIYQDTLLKQYFPYTLIPHYVWIDQSGRVINFTSSISQQSIDNYLRDKVVTEPTKIDVDRNIPLFLKSDLLDNQYPDSYQFFRRGTYHGLPSGTQITRDGQSRILMTNVDVMRMYRVIAARYAREVLKDSTYQSSRFIMSFVPSLRDSEYHNLDIILPISKNDVLFRFALNYLNEFSLYHGAFSKNEKNELTFILNLKDDLPYETR